MSFLRFFVLTTLVCAMNACAATKAVSEIDEAPAWIKNAVAVDDIDEASPKIALVIDDLGVNRKMTRQVIALPAPLTASFLSYADDLPAQTELARLAGHELLVHTPMEPVDSRFDAGPDALKTDMTPDEIRENLSVMLDAFSGYVGINNHMGSKFTSAETDMRIVMDEINRRGLLFLDSLTSGRSTAAAVARQTGTPFAVRNVFLDNARTEADILRQLSLLECHARRHGFAVGIGHPHKATVNALDKWIPAAKRRGVVFVPVSAIALYMLDADKPAHTRALNRHDESE